MRGVIESAPGTPRALREEWALDGPAEARRLTASGVEQGDRATAWALTAGFGPKLQVMSVDLQVRPPDHASEVTTVAFRCHAGLAFGTTIGPGGVPEKTATAFPEGSAFRGFSTALDGLTAVSAPLRPGHGRRLLVIELDAEDHVPRVRDWMVLAVAKRRADATANAPWAIEYDFRRADAPGRTQSTVLASLAGGVHRATRHTREGPVELLSTALAP